MYTIFLIIRFKNMGKILVLILSSAGLYSISIIRSTNNQWLIPNQYINSICISMNRVSRSVCLNVRLFSNRIRKAANVTVSRYLRIQIVARKEFDGSTLSNIIIEHRNDKNMISFYRTWSSIRMLISRRIIETTFGF